LEEHSGKKVAVVCHGGTIRMLLSILLGLPLSRMALFEIEYASITDVHLHPHKTEIQLLNFTPWRDLA
jgi:alpha-ribazole phosphatase